MKQYEIDNFSYIVKQEFVKNPLLQTLTNGSFTVDNMKFPWTAEKYCATLHITIFLSERTYIKTREDLPVD